MKQVILLLLLLLFGTANTYSQFGTIIISELEYNYQFSDSTFNTTVWVDQGIILNTNIGQLRFLVPFSPIERSVDIDFAKYLQNDSQLFEFSGLLDGEYDFEKNGTYELTGRGVMKVNKSNVGRGYSAKTKVTVTGSIVHLEIVVPLTLEDYGFDIDRIHEKVIVDEITVTISGEAKLK